MTRTGMMLSSLAAAAMLGLFAVGTTDVAGAQTKNESPISASRFGISVDGTQKPKTKGLKSQSSKKGSGANYKAAERLAAKVGEVRHQPGPATTAIFGGPFTRCNQPKRPGSPQEGREGVRLPD